jgi:hypothetical protein
VPVVDSLVVTPDVLDLIAWIAERLEAHPDLAGRVFRESAIPQETPLPYASFRLVSSPDSRASGGRSAMGNPLIRAVAVGRPTQIAELHAMKKALDDRLAQVGEVTTAALFVRGSHRESEFHVPDRVQQFNAVIDGEAVGGFYRFRFQSRNVPPPP